MKETKENQIEVSSKKRKTLKIHGVLICKFVLTNVNTSIEIMILKNLDGNEEPTMKCQSTSIVDVTAFTAIPTKSIFFQWQSI